MVELEARRQLGFRGDCRNSVDHYPSREWASPAVEVSRASPRAISFAGTLVFGPARWFHHHLHPDPSKRIREALDKRGAPVTVIPVVIDTPGSRVPERNS